LYFIDNAIKKLKENMFSFKKKEEIKESKAEEVKQEEIALDIREEIKKIGNNVDKFIFKRKLNSFGRSDYEFEYKNLSISYYLDILSISKIYLINKNWKKEKKLYLYPLQLSKKEEEFLDEKFLERAKQEKKKEETRLLEEETKLLRKVKFD